MEIIIDVAELSALGLPDSAAAKLKTMLESHFHQAADAKSAWFGLDKTALIQYPFPVQRYIFEKCYPTWREHPETAAAWQPCAPEETNLAAFLRSQQLPDLNSARELAVKDCAAFWGAVLACLPITFAKKPDAICDLSVGVENPQWLPGARMNIACSCFQANPNAIAMIYLDHLRQQHNMTYAKLNTIPNTDNDTCSKNSIGKR